jgi:hypothetical protein
VFGGANDTLTLGATATLLLEVHDNPLT